jgi:molybdopterin converting factor small subunit
MTVPGTVTVRLFAAARAAAGTGEVLLPAGRLDELLARLCADRPPRLAEVLAASSLVHDGVRLDPRSPTPIPAGAVIDVLPPFAGG